MQEQDQLRALADIEALRRFKARYGQLVDALVCGSEPAMLEELAGMFTDDALADFRPTLGIFRGRAEICRMFGTILPQSRSWIWHSFHSADIDVRGDIATARWTIYALATSKAAPDAAPQIIYGRYVDEYVRHQHAWRQTKLTFVNETRGINHPDKEAQR